jgi:hypothetical protein
MCQSIYLYVQISNDLQEKNNVLNGILKNVSFFKSRGMTPKSKNMLNSEIELDLLFIITGDV